MTLSERSLSWLTDTVLPCGFVGPQRHHAEVRESFRKKSTKVNICSEPDTISGCAMAQFGNRDYRDSRAEFYGHDRGMHRGWYRNGDRTVIIKRHRYWDD